MSELTDSAPVTTRFKGKVVIVTGSGAGIGYETALRFAAEGARVAVVDIDGPAAEGTVKAIEAEGGTALALTVDVTNSEAVTAAVSRVIEAFGRIDVLVNNAGHGTPQFAAEMTADDWDLMLTTNLRSSFLVSRAVWEPFKAQGRGVILNASSITGQWAMFGLAAYGAAKAGLVTMTKVMAIEGGPVGIRVNCVSPGYILTPGFQEFIDLQADPDAFHHAMASQSALGRFGSPRDVAEAYLYLASDAASWVTGTNLVIDGGITAGQLPSADPRV